MHRDIRGERDRAGEIVFPDPCGRGVFTFDENDGLIFMAEDTGDRIRPAVLPTESEGAVEIEITDPVNRGCGWHRPLI